MKRSFSWRRAALAASVALVLTACGGGGDDEGSDESAESSASSTSTTSTTTTSTTTSSTSTTLPAAVAPEYVTEGATIQVANASRVNGGAGRLSDRLAEVGFVTAEPTNSGEAYSRLEVTQIYHAPGSPEVLAVAESLLEAFGGNGELVELASPAPTESGDVPAGVNIVVLMGNDIADIPLEELQGLTAPAEETDTSEAETSDSTASSSTEAP